MPDASLATRLTMLQAAVEAAEASIAGGRVVRIPTRGLRDYIRARGERAARIATAQTT